MGSLSSRPKAPPVPQTVYVPQVQYVPAPVTPAPAQKPAADAQPDGGESAPQPAARQANLLERSRGALSTILTGFRGVLDDSASPTRRKTLLGE